MVRVGQTLTLLSIENLSILCICVYFPTDYHDAQSSDAFLSTLCEIEGFIDSIAFDHVVTAGDFNVDPSVSFPRATLFTDFLHHLWRGDRVQRSHAGFHSFA